MVTGKDFELRSESSEAALNAIMALAGCTFKDRVIVATFVTKDFMDYCVQRNAGMIPASFDKATAIVMA